MQDGWYCRATTLAQEEQAEPNVDVDDEEESTVDDDSRTGPAQNHPKAFSQPQTNNQDKPDHKGQYRYLKRKLKFLIYENEFLQEVLRSNQRRLLKVSRDRTFLLDRLLQYEKPDESSDSDLTESSDDDGGAAEAKKKKPENPTAALPANSNSGGTPVPTSTRGRKRKLPPQNTADSSMEQPSVVKVEKLNEQPPTQPPPPPPPQAPGQFITQDMSMRMSGNQVNEQMTDVSLNREPQEHLMDVNAHVAAEECVAMEYTTT